MSKSLSAKKIRSLFTASAHSLHQGDPARAQRGFEKLAAALPDSAAVWYNLALSYQHLQQHRKAADAYRTVVRLDAANVDALINLGLAQKHLDQPDQALQSADRALQLAPDHPRALNLAGTLYAEKKQTEQARAALERALAVDAGNADARYNLANLLLQSGDTEAALKLVDELLQQGHRGQPQRQLHGQILIELKRFADAAAVIAQLKAEFADDPEVLLLELSWCEMTKDYFGTVELAQQLLQQQPDNPRLWNSLGSAYFQLDSVDKAADCYRKAVAFDPDHPEYQNNLGLTYAANGDKAPAEACYRRSIELDPEHAEAHRNLVAMKKFTTLDADAERIQTLWQQPHHSDFIRTKLAFALGKVYDDLGQYDRAFDTYAVGNRLKFAEAGLDFDRYFAHIDSIPATFTEHPQQVSEVITEHTPIFILGMPRSGTTLVEQILCRHPAVTGCGELPCIEKAISRMEKRAQPMRVYPRDFLQLQPPTLSVETDHYLAWVERLHELKTAFFTDKMPFNFVHIWLIKALFPGAAVVHCHRHPLDVILSNYFQLYASDVSFVYDLPVLARYYVRYRRLMRHWHRLFAGALVQVQYERLVSHAEQEIRRLIAAVNLPWDDACLDRSKAGAAVRTASIWQVRQGIYTTSTRRWRHYQQHLQPAITLLQAEGVLDSELNDID